MSAMWCTVIPFRSILQGIVRLTMCEQRCKVWWSTPDFFLWGFIKDQSTGHPHVCMYIWDFRARQDLRSLAPVRNEYWWLWWPNDIQGPWRTKAPWHMSYRWGKTAEKTSPRKLVPTGDRTRAYVISQTYKGRFYAAVNNVTPQMLHNTWVAVECQLDIYRATNGSHVEVHGRQGKKNLMFTLCSHWFHL